MIQNCHGKNAYLNVLRNNATMYVNNNTKHMIQKIGMPKWIFKFAMRFVWKFSHALWKRKMPKKLWTTTCICHGKNACSILLLKNCRVCENNTKNDHKMPWEMCIYNCHGVFIKVVMARSTCYSFHVGTHLEKISKVAMPTHLESCHGNCSNVVFLQWQIKMLWHGNTSENVVAKNKS